MRLKTVARQAIREAGKILMDNVGKIKEVRLKQKNDYLANIDIAAEAKIKQVIRVKFPHHDLVAEESDVETKGSIYKWYIDPISSTRNYVHGLPHFGITLALQKRQEFILSMVLDPFFNELFEAVKGEGAYLNGKKIAVSATNTLAKTLVFLDIPTRDGLRKREGIAYFRQALPQIGSYRRLGSLALELCYVACGRVDGLIYNDMNIFSLPAGKLILEEAGGKLTDLKGKAWYLKSKSTLASNGKIHKTLVRVVNF